MCSCFAMNTRPPNVSIEWLELMLRTWKVPLSNLGLGQAILMGFVVFLSSSTQMLGWYLKIGRDSFVPHPFQFVSCIHPVIRRYIASAM